MRNKRRTATGVHCVKVSDIQNSISLPWTIESDSNIVKKLSIKISTLKLQPESCSFDFTKRQSLKGSGSEMYKYYTTDIKVGQLRNASGGGYCNRFVMR